MTFPDFTAVTYHDRYTLVFASDDEATNLPDQLVITSDDLASGFDFDRETNAPASWSTTIPSAPGMEDWALQKVWVFFNGEIIMRGELKEVTTDGNSQITTLKGVGVLDELKSGYTEKTYEYTQVKDAIDDYRENYTDFGGWVEVPDIDFVDRNIQVQEANFNSQFESLVGSEIENKNLPFSIESNSIKLLPTSWILESNDSTSERTTTGSFSPSPDFTETHASVLRENQKYDTNGQTDYVEWDFTIEHTIPSIFFGCRMRADALGTGAPPWEGYIIHPNGQEYLLDRHTFVGDSMHPSGVAWYEIAQESSPDPYTRGRPYDGPDLEPGTYTIGIRCTEYRFNYDPNTFGLAVDALCVYDERYTDTDGFDYVFGEWNSVTNGHLDGPPRTGPVKLTFDKHNDVNSVSEGRVKVNMNDVSGGQKLQVSNSEGKLWSPMSSYANNKEQMGIGIGTAYGTSIQARVTFDAFTPDGTPRDTASPRYGYDLQELYSFELRCSTTNRAVIDTLELSGNDFENLKKIHEAGGYEFSAQYLPFSKNIRSAVPGDATEDLDVDVLSHRRTIDGSDYANVVVVVGEDDDGDTLTFTWYNSAEIADRGRKESPSVKRPDVNTLAQLRTIGRPILREKIDSLDLRGTMKIVPKDVQPGYTYTHEAFDNIPMYLRRVSFSDSGNNPTGTLDFKEPDRFVKQFREVERDINRLSN